jgi:hypothetical protein
VLGNKNDSRDVPIVDGAGNGMAVPEVDCETVARSNSDNMNAAGTVLVVGTEDGDCNNQNGEALEKLKAGVDE